MDRTSRIADLKIEMARWEESVAQAVAKVRGIEVEIAALEAGVAGSGDLASIPQQTAAILAVNAGPKQPRPLVENSHT